MKTSLRARLPDRQDFLRLADWLAVGVALSLPWSTSATSILIVLWFLAWVPTFDVSALRREVASSAGGLPVLLWALGALGMLWAAVSTRSLGLSIPMWQRQTTFAPVPFSGADQPHGLRVVEHHDVVAADQLHQLARRSTRARRS